MGCRGNRGSSSANAVTPHAFELISGAGNAAAAAILDNAASANRAVLLGVDALAVAFGKIAFRAIEDERALHTVLILAALGGAVAAMVHVCKRVEATTIGVRSCCARHILVAGNIRCRTTASSLDAALWSASVPAQAAMNGR